MNKNKRMLSPKIDVVFRMLFGEQKHERITKSNRRKSRNNRIRTNTVSLGKSSR